MKRGQVYLGYLICATVKFLASNKTVGRSGLLLNHVIYLIIW